MSADILQTPSIIGIEGSTIRVAHPNISNYTRHYLRSSVAASGTTLALDDNTGFEDNDWFITGEIGDAKTEEGDVNGAVTKGTAMTITNTNSFAHDIDSPITKIYERGIKIYGAANDGGVGTLIDSVDAKVAATRQLADAIMIRWDKQYTEYTMISTDTAYAYYYVTFTDGVTDSSASDYVLAGGLASNAIQHQIDSALEMCDEEINETGKITRKFLLNQCNKWQDTVTQYVYSNEAGVRLIKDWSFELVENDTSITAVENENRYALSSLTYELKYPNSNQGIFSVYFGTNKLRYIDPDEMDKKFEGVPKTYVKTAITAGDTSIVLDDTYEFEESGTVMVGEDTITYTGNTEATGTLTGCTDVDNNHDVDETVWQNAASGMPEYYTIFNGYLIVDVPIADDYAGYKFKIKYLKKLTRFTSFSDTTEIPFYNNLETFLRSRIETRKGNRAEVDKIMIDFEIEIARNAAADVSLVLDNTQYLQFDNN